MLTLGGGVQTAGTTGAPSTGGGARVGLAGILMAKRRLTQWRTKRQATASLRGRKKLENSYRWECANGMCVRLRAGCPFNINGF